LRKESPRGESLTKNDPFSTPTPRKDSVGSDSLPKRKESSGSDSVASSYDEKRSGILYEDLTFLNEEN